MGKKESVQYTVEREFLSKITVKELIIRIIKSHVKSDTEKGGG